MRFSAALESLKNELRYMKIEKKISLLFLCAAMLTMAACGKTHGTDEEETRQAVGFVPQSEANLVKATTPLSAFHSDFGVWGIARHATQNDIILWESNAMSEVKQQGNTEVYVPVSDAYWFSGYTYDFIAVAPWDLAKDISSINKGTVSGTDNLSFTYSLADKYAAGAYKFDPMAAVAESTVNTTAASWTSQQNITFWHLSSQIVVIVNFVNANGVVKGMRLHNVDTDCNYTISFDNNNLDVETSSPNPTQTNQAVISCDSDHLDKNTTNQWSVHIHPQNISDFNLYLDFYLTDGSQTVSMTNCEINLGNAKANPIYKNNESYNWRINISPNAITFDVSVTPWDAADVNGDGIVDEDDEFEFELQ